MYRPAKVTEAQKQAAHAFYAKAQAIVNAPERAPFTPAVESPAAYEPRAEQRIVANRDSFILRGNATFTVVSKATGTRFTFKVRAPKTNRDGTPRTDDNGLRFVSVLTGPDNGADYAFLGTIFPDGSFRHSAKSAIANTAPSARAFAWFHANTDSDRCEVWHEGKCCRCGRALTVPSSIEAGIGPECAEKAM